MHFTRCKLGIHLAATSSHSKCLDMDRDGTLSVDEIKFMVPGSMEDSIADLPRR